MDEVFQTYYKLINSKITECLVIFYASALFYIIVLNFWGGRGNVEAMGDPHR